MPLYVVEVSLLSSSLNRLQSSNTNIVLALVKLHVL